MIDKLVLDSSTSRIRSILSSLIVVGWMVLAEKTSGVVFGLRAGLPGLVGPTLARVSEGDDGRYLDRRTS
jgi:hypothetical protein